MFRHVLVPLDIRFVPKFALMTAAALANDQDAQLTLLHVSDIAIDFHIAADTAITDDFVKRGYDDLCRFLDNALAIIAEYGSTAAIRVINGFPVHTMINSAAEELEADLIVMGTHGRRGLAHALSGSVTENVVREAAVPVLAIHESPKMTFSPASWARLAL
jgi:nucleotide-binding universal stress UspA family protein